MHELKGEMLETETLLRFTVTKLNSRTVNVLHGAPVCLAAMTTPTYHGTVDTQSRHIQGVNKR